MVKLSDPEVPFDPCQEPEAEHDVAFDELHDSVIGVDSTTDDDEALKVTIGSGLTNQSNNVAIKIPFNTATFNQGGGTFDTSRMAELMGYGQPEEAKRDMVAVDTLKKAGKSVNDVPESLTNALTRDYSDLMKAINKKGK